MSEVVPQPVLRVRARWPRRRAGFAFGPEPRVLTVADFGEVPDDAMDRVLAIVTDPVLKVEKPIGFDAAMASITASDVPSDNEENATTSAKDRRS